jgi:hypothetical protein
MGARLSDPHAVDRGADRVGADRQRGGRAVQPAQAKRAVVNPDPRHRVAADVRDHEPVVQRLVYVRERAWLGGGRDLERRRIRRSDIPDLVVIRNTTGVGRKPEPVALDRLQRWAVVAGRTEPLQVHLEPQLPIHHNRQQGVADAARRDGDRNLVGGRLAGAGVHVSHRLSGFDVAVAVDAVAGAAHRHDVRAFLQVGAAAVTVGDHVGEVAVVVQRDPRKCIGKPGRGAAVTWRVAEIRRVVAGERLAELHRLVAVLKKYQDAVAATPAPLGLCIGQPESTYGRDAVIEDERARAVMSLGAQSNHALARRVVLFDSAAANRLLMKPRSRGQTHVPAGSNPHLGMLDRLATPALGDQRPMGNASHRRGPNGHDSHHHRDARSPRHSISAHNLPAFGESTGTTQSSTPQIPS